MDTVKIFNNGNSQAVRLPKAYILEGKVAFIAKIGDAIIILLFKKRWDSLFQSLDKFSEDFMTERNQPLLENGEKAF